MALLVAQKITQAGLIPTYAAAAASDTLLNTGIQYFHVKNGHDAEVTISVVPVVTTVIDPLLGSLVKETAKLVLAAGAEGFLGPFEVDAFNSATGTIAVSSSIITNVTIAALYI